MKRLRGCLGILLIFVFGFFVGGFLGFAAGWVTFFHKVVKGGPVAVREILFQRAKDDLHLDYGQQEEVRAILQETSAELDSETSGVRPAVEDALGRAEQRIRAILKPEQLRKFDGFMNEARKKWSRVPATPPGAGQPETSGQNGHDGKIESEPAKPPEPAPKPTGDQAGGTLEPAKPGMPGETPK